MANRWRLDVDHGVCVGSGLCVGHAPAAFELNGARQSRPRVTEVDADDVVLDAAENCPTEAITITDAATGTVLFPPAEEELVMVRTSTVRGFSSVPVHLG